MIFFFHCKFKYWSIRYAYNKVTRSNFQADIVRLKEISTLNFNIVINHFTVSYSSEFHVDPGGGERELLQVRHESNVLSSPCIFVAHPKFVRKDQFEKNWQLPTEFNRSKMSKKKHGLALYNNRILNWKATNFISLKKKLNPWNLSS